MPHPRCTTLGQQRPARHSDVARGGRYMNCPIYGGRPSASGTESLSTCRARCRLVSAGPAPGCPGPSSWPYNPGGKAKCTHASCRVQHSGCTSSLRCLPRCCSKRLAKQAKQEWQSAQGLRLQGHLGQEEKKLCCTGCQIKRFASQTRNRSPADIGRWPETIGGMECRLRHLTEMVPYPAGRQAPEEMQA